MTEEWFDAAKRGDIDTLQRLINSGTPIDSLDELLCSALSYAVSKCYIDVITMLLDRGADPNLRLVLEHFSRLCSVVSAMPHVIEAFGGAEEVEGVGDELLEFFNGPLGGGSQEGLELGERQFDWVQVGAVGGQEQQAATRCLDRIAGLLTLVRGEVVEDHDVAGVERRHHVLLDVGHEQIAVHRTVDHQRCLEAVGRQQPHEGDRLPLAVRHAVHDSLAPRSTAVGPRHPGVGSGLVEELQLRGLEFLLSLPKRDAG